VKLDLIAGIMVPRRTHDRGFAAVMPDFGHQIGMFGGRRASGFDDILACKLLRFLEDAPAEIKDSA
jgi:hypothetical protein